MKTFFRPESVDSETADDKNDSIETSDWSAAAADSDYLIGLVLLVISFSLFMAANYFLPGMSTITFGKFGFNYVIAVGYTIFLMINGKLRWLWKAQEREYQAHRLLLWSIWLVSCFALNSLIPVFYKSAPWLSAAITLSVITCILFPLQHAFSKFLLNIFYFLFGTSTLLWTYYAIYLSWIYPLSIPALLIFGLSFHSFVPFMLLVNHIRVVFSKWEFFKVPLVLGMVFPFLTVVYFSMQWHATTSTIKSKVSLTDTLQNEELPTWVLLGQILDNDWITEMLIKGSLVYQIPKSFLTFVPDNVMSGDVAQHDPLVLIASLVNPKTELSGKERIKLLDVLFDGRHNTQERLWSGRDLSIHHVDTQVQIYPDYRFAYTEKTIEIENRSRQNNWREALFTFHLPEGSVVTSLSLWVNGREEKAYLTSQTKADSAYKTIVGYESRDPSVIHWQEGNTVRVKVFPCTPQERRRFKIGITSPLRFEKNKLIYENIYFQGPGSSDATESTTINFSKSTSAVDIAFATKKIGKNKLVYNGKYRPYWDASFDAPPVSHAGFTFQKKTYFIESYTSAPERFDLRTVYLDVNSAWSRPEFDELCSLLKGSTLYMYDSQFVKLSEANKNQMFEKCRTNRYSLFPVHKVPDLSTSLLITKGTATSPNLMDLQGSKFGESLKKIKNTIPLRTFNIGAEVSPYLKALDELRIIRSEKADLADIKKLLRNNEFPEDPELDEQNKGTTVQIRSAKLLIRETSGTTPSKAPDHLYRLFAYNHMMKQIGPRYLDKSYLESSETNARFIEEATTANIVTPVSSLIVLESKADYQRFDIKKSKNSLDNAGMNNMGAVPEPQEWVLIILFLCLIAYHIYRNYVR